MDTKEFLYLQQNATTNFLARFSTKNKKEEFKENDNIFTATYGSTELTISYDLDKYDEVPDFYVSCQKLQRIIMCLFTAQGFTSNIITVAANDIFDLQGIANNNRNKSTIRNDLKKLQDTRVDFTEKRKIGKSFKHIEGSFNIISGWSWSHDGYLRIEIPQMLINTLKEYGGLIQYPISNFKLNNKKLVEFAINDRIAERLGSRDIVSISTLKLYECALAAGMKSYEYFSNKKIKTGFYVGIVRPIEEALNAGSFYKWKYREKEEHSTFNAWLIDYVEISRNEEINNEEGRDEKNGNND